MTFTFTLDAFPDYTKFDPTHKVLAAIQVISDTEDEQNDLKRDPCAELDNPLAVDAAIDAAEDGVNATIAGNTVVVTGTSAGATFDSDLFGPTLPVKATEVILTLPTDQSGGTYRVIQNNPVLKYFQDPSNGVSGTNKTKEYNVRSGATLDYSFLVSEMSGPIDIELQKADGTTIVKYIVATAISFT